jgi:arsenate reductase
MLKLHGIPTCDTCKKARAWLEARGVAHAWIDLRQTPPAAAQVERWVQKLGDKALRNTSGQSYRALGDAKQRMTAAEWTAAFSRDPMLLKRPILERDGEPLAAGFKPERYLELLGA